MAKNILSIDIGNSNPHVGFWKNNQLEKVIPLNQASEIELESGLLSLSSVVDIPDFLKERSFIRPTMLRQNNQLMDMPILYSESLGEDRLAAAYAVYSELEPGQSATIIDSGTFTTIDHISREYGFEGGYIIPGIKIFLQSYGQGHLLPGDIEPTCQEADQWPIGTREAILGGLNLFLEGIALNLESKWLGNRLILTGSYASVWECLFDHQSIEVREHLVHTGLFKLAKGKLS